MDKRFAEPALWSDDSAVGFAAVAACMSDWGGEPQSEPASERGEESGYQRPSTDQAAQAQGRLAAIRDDKTRIAAMQSSIVEDLPRLRQLFGTARLSAPVGRRLAVTGPDDERGAEMEKEHAHPAVSATDPHA